ncbi:MAG TPA: Gmad2 immunoglobulin-like domain-containing protein [Gaiellaceae bacterium]|nr:Gmad2 immunoglobulin-like domain-containing protein [Gaiellaceae bacterium]
MKVLIAVAAVVLALAVGFLVAGLVTDSDATSAGPVPSGPTTTEDTTEVAPTTTGEEEPGTGTETEPVADEVTYQVWFVNDDGLFVAYRTEPATPRVGTAAVESLLEGPDAFETGYGLSTAIPEGTELLGLTIGDGIARADLTSEFESGGGTLSMQSRLAQVVFTLTQFPTVDGVVFSLDGEPVDVLGGEGIIIDQPLTRRDFADLLPVILVTTPALNQAVESPILIRGSANVFEANVGIQILDEDGDVIVETFTTATCGSGCRGTYRTTVPYRVDRAQNGTIVVHDDDAAGTGSFPHEVRIPVRLLP